jgi:hypothetical protein
VEQEQVTEKKADDDEQSKQLDLAKKQKPPEMVKMLEEHDGSEQIGEMPTISEWTKQGFSDSKYSSNTHIIHQINKMQPTLTLNNKSSNLMRSKNR